MTVEIDAKGALLYAGALYTLLAASDPREVTNHLVTRAILRGLLTDLAAGIPDETGKKMRLVIATLD